MTSYYAVTRSSNYLQHYGTLGMKWGVRRYQNKDGSLTEEGRKRYRKDTAKTYGSVAAGVLGKAAVSAARKAVTDIYIANNQLAILSSLGGLAPATLSYPAAAVVIASAGPIISAISTGAIIYGLYKSVQLSQVEKIVNNDIDEYYKEKEDK